MASILATSDVQESLAWLKKGAGHGDWQSSYSLNLIKRENISVENAIAVATAATREDALNYAAEHPDGNMPEGLVAPMLISRVAPVMPAVLATLNIEATVKVKFLVNQEGTPVNIQVNGTSGYELLDQAAVTAISQWRFKPASKNGVALPAAVTVPMRFNYKR